jgi:aldose 1-epimerase
MQIYSKAYGVTTDGEAVTQYVMQSDAGVEVRVLNYGCIITHLFVPDRTGAKRDIVLGYDDLHSYELDGTGFGAFIGRYANRIKGSAFTLDGQEYRLTPNDGNNHLHGVFAKRVFSCTVSGNHLQFFYSSPDGEDGFPGMLDVSVIYTLDDAGVFSLSYDAACDAPTVLNLTNHSYFNLSGHNSGPVNEQLLQIAADEFLEAADDICPTGHALSVERTPFDFRTLQRIGQGFPVASEQMEVVGGYDHCFLLRPDAAPAVLAYSPESGIAMELVTTQPAVQFYSGNFLDDNPLPGKGGILYAHQDGFALETQHYPCSPNYPEFPTTVLRPGEDYHETTLLKFFVAK